MEIVVHTIKMGDVVDPDLNVAGPMLDWEQSDVGQWVMNYATTAPRWIREFDNYGYGWVYKIIADFKDEDITFYKLKWS
jgi:hypothetical protein